MSLQDLPRILTNDNIQDVKRSYYSILENVPFNVESDNLLGFLTKIKRDSIKVGPYPDVTLFEAANRIMTDLTILKGVEMLLNGFVPQITFDSYSVEFGNENNQEHDIQADSEGVRLKGEAFNVAKSFFQGKKSSALGKLRKTMRDNDILVIIYNSDALGKNYTYKKVENEYHVQVTLDVV